MSTNPRIPKRKPSTTQDRVSPPLPKRKVQSTTNKNAVASFFTPASQKEPDRVTWRTVDDSLLIAKYLPKNTDTHEKNKSRPTAIAAFDLDGTLVTTSSGKKYSSDAHDWKWWDASVLGELHKLHGDRYQVIIVSNQGGLNLAKDSKTAKADQKRVADFKGKVSAVLGALDLPTSVYAATQNDRFRKPRDGMWKMIVEDYDLDEGNVLDLDRCVFVGDAAGREKDEDGMGKKDFACSDRNFASNVGIRFFTPEEYFLKAQTRSYKRDFDPQRYLQSANGVHIDKRSFSKQNSQDVVVLCGSPGVGKSTFYWTQLQPAGYERVNQDILKTRDKCLKKAEEFLQEGRSVAIDNTNADSDTRAHWLRLATRFQVPARCVYLRGDPKLCQHNDTLRALAGGTMNPETRAMLPAMAFNGYHARHEPPQASEGFQDVVHLAFEFQGTDEQREIWSRFWI